MSIEQAYFFSVALINLVFAFAGTRVKALKIRDHSIIFFMISFFAYFVSWFIYVFEISTILEMISAFASTVFVWGMVLFGCKRTEANVPLVLIISLFSINCAAQFYFIQHNNLTYYLHISGLFLPLAFGSISYMFLKVKKKRYPSDKIVGYAFLIMSFIIVGRSMLMELAPDLFARSSMYSQIIWPAFCSVVGVFTLLSYTEEVQHKLELESHTDQLTGIHNRRKFDDRLEKTINALSVTNYIGTLIYLDLDGFKPINDRYGHPIGDNVLVEISARLKNNCQPNQFIARLGGDEFAIITFNLGYELEEAKHQAIDIAHDIQQLINKPIYTQGLTLQVDCSIGIHMLLPNSKSAHDALREADNAMYLSKKEKRGSIHFSNTATTRGYGFAKVGITDIDEEHQLLDDLIQSLRDGHHDFSSVKSIVEERIKKHFNNEVEVSNKLGLNLTEEHMKHHFEIMTLLNELSDISDKETAQEYLSSVQNILQDHALKFDSSLNHTLSTAKQST